MSSTTSTISLPPTAVEAIRGAGAKTWLASAQVIGQGQAVVLAVQPLETWRELWIFHRRGGAWVVDVLPPGIDDPDEGYIEYAGYVPGTGRRGQNRHRR